MTHIRSTMAAALLVFGGAAVAAAQQGTPAPAPQAQSAHAHRGQRGPGRRAAFGRNIQHQLFKGITLSDAEKTNLASVRAKYAPQMKAIRAQTKTLLESERNDMRAALTPEDQAKFDTNAKRVKQRVGARASKAWKKGGPRA